MTPGCQIPGPGQMAPRLCGAPGLNGNGIPFERPIARPYLKACHGLRVCTMIESCVPNRVL